jgi:hypothetical protein
MANIPEHIMQTLVSAHGFSLKPIPSPIIPWINDLPASKRLLARVRRQLEAQRLYDAFMRTRGNGHG